MKTIETGGGDRVAVLEQGPAGAPPLVLLNGSIFNLRQWDRYVRAGGWTRSHRLIRYDYLDTGGSSRRRGPVSIRALAAELVELLDALGIEAAHFYGTSQGTMVLQGLAALAPERILSGAGYGWYFGDFTGREATIARIGARLPAFERLHETWDQPLDRDGFDVLWAATYRRALLNADWGELSLAGKARDWLLRRVLYPLIAPTPVAVMHAWFHYCVTDLLGDRDWLSGGLTALAERPLLIQHAVADQTLEVGMARELSAAHPGAKLLEYGEGYDHASPAFKTPQARRVVADHQAFLALR